MPEALALTLRSTKIELLARPFYVHIKDAGSFNCLTQPTICIYCCLSAAEAAAAISQPHCRRKYTHGDPPETDDPDISCSGTYRKRELVWLGERQKIRRATHRLSGLP